MIEGAVCRMDLEDVMSIAGALDNMTAKKLEDTLGGMSPNQWRCLLIGQLMQKGV